MLTNPDHRGPAVCSHVLLLFAGFQPCLLCVHKRRDLIKLGGDFSKLSVQVERPAVELMPKFVPRLAHTALLLGLGVQKHADTSSSFSYAAWSTYDRIWLRLLALSFSFP